MQEPEAIRSQIHIPAWIPSTISTTVLRTPDSLPFTQRAVNYASLFRRRSHRTRNQNSHTSKLIYWARLHIKTVKTGLPGWRTPLNPSPIFPPNWEWPPSHIARSLYHWIEVHYHHDPSYLRSTILSTPFPYLEESLYTRSHVQLVQSLDYVVQFRWGCLGGIRTFSILHSVIASHVHL